MAHSAYPTAGQLESYIRSMGILTDAQLAELLAHVDLTSIAAGAQAAWEADSGWKPFLRDASPVARRFDPPGPNRRGLTRGGWERLELDAGLLAVTAFVTGYSATAAGTAFVVEDDYWLWPPNAAVEDRPYTAIDANWYQWGQPQSIRITGYWGFSANIPGDAWEAILRQGAQLAYSQIFLTVSGGVTSWTEADITEQYALGAFKAHADAWAEQWRRAVGRYRRPYL
jgi:hypothetical protein